ncbi:formate dehydrogenase [Pedobacter lusitanus]|uniref:Sulfur carrier protein FdhD n=1 Tax=Pedobacter lusitanus TaxID=1503925 RepID=A0A0D0GWQ0_9SPHI|nr:formate dehydrogenase accessory sulfurtransferase FdhD [Pedobacter lusitanus]KIO78826.1 formate dehydrogenase [Pedobacter lusitanus]
MVVNDSESISTKNVVINRINSHSSSALWDVLSVEEPLEIRICYGSASRQVKKNISVTMRTPGNDADLAIGFLFTEGIISSYVNIKKVYHLEVDCSMQKQNIVQVELADNFVPHLMQSDRNFYTTSSCGVCGKGSIQSIKTVSPFSHINRPEICLPIDVFYQLPVKLKEAQNEFAATGGIHASGLFTLEGDLILLREDVGRHNALDKLIGRALSDNSLPLAEHILLLSGRASFELIQKAAMAGISIVAAIGAPSSLAVELAKEFDMTLLGFLKENRFNIYNESKYHRIMSQL